MKNIKKKTSFSPAFHKYPTGSLNRKCQHVVKNPAFHFSQAPLSSCTCLVVYLGQLEQQSCLSISWMRALICSSYWALCQWSTVVANKGRGSFLGRPALVAFGRNDHFPYRKSWCSGGMPEMSITTHCSHFPPPPPLASAQGIFFVGGSRNCFHTDHSTSRYTCWTAAFFNSSLFFLSFFFF